ncbi:MAG: GNAT family N-acetyltransferase [Armatimonas sp.]
MISWRCVAFDDLTVPELYKILAARAEVFVVEQTCPYQDLDNHDQQGWHLLGEAKSGELAAYLRILPPGEKYTEAAIGRVLTSASFRGTGIGRVLVSQGIAQCEGLYPNAGIRISAQAHLEKFYGSLGFQTVSDVYDEDGIPHIEMLCPPA